jgi:nucleoside-diphosphate-sugar epimerase
MKILMIGGTRFFGKRFVQLMLDQGHSMTLLTRGQNADDFGNRVSRIVADRTSAQQLKNAVKSDYDVVVDNMLMNAQEANDMISIMRDRIKHFVMTSTLSVYDPKPGALLESDFEATADYPGANYQQGKRSAEHALAQAPFGVSIMRIPLIVGPDDYTQRLLTHVKAVKENNKLFFPNPDARFSYLHAQDAARALAWLCTEKPKGVFNIGAPNAWTLRELISCIEMITNHNFSYGDADDELSPFGIEQDYFMNVSKAQRAGFQVDALEKWMPALIEELAKKPGE